MKVLVVGDVIIDRYTHGKKLGISAETPTVVGEFEREDMFIGGAGLVVRNLLRLGCEATLLTTANCHESAFYTFMHDQTDRLTPEELERFRVEIYSLPMWRFTEKRRYYVDEYKLLQYDVLNRGGYVQHQSEAFLQKFRMHLDTGKFQGVVICDNRHGVLTPEIASGILNISRTYGVMTYVDSQVSQNRSNHGWYEGADWILLNNGEALGLMQLTLVERFGSGGVDFSKLTRVFNSNIVVKIGAGGAMLFTKDGGSEYSPGFKVDAVDTCGAGDAFIAAFATHGNLEESNRWAALSTTYKGTIVPQIADLEKVTRETSA